MLLKVQCEKCKTRYKLDETRIQGKGAKITCPKCRHIFVVMKDALQAGGDDDGEGMLQDNASESVSTSQIPAVNLQAASTAAVAAARPPEAPPAPVSDEPEVMRPASAESLSWKDVGLTSFKVKVAIGLVYDFSDIGTLRKYIGEKRVAPTDRISFDGKTWTVIKDVPDLDAFFIDQWVALKKERLKEERAGRSPSGPTIGDGRKGGSEKKSTSRMPAFNPSEGEAGTGPRRTAWSADAGGESSGLSGQDLFGDMSGSEDTAALGALMNRKAEGNKAGNATARRNAAPVPEPRTSGAATTVLSQAPARTTLPVTPTTRTGFNPVEWATLLLLLGVTGFLAWQNIQTLSTSESLPTFDSQAEAAELDTLFKTHFPYSLGAQEAPDAATESTGGKKAGTGEADKGGNKGADKGADKGTDKGADKGTEKSGDAKAAGKPDKSDEGKSSKAEDTKAAKKGGKDAGSSVSVGSITAEDLFQLAQESLRAKDYAGAVASLQSAVSMKPGNATYQYTLGYALLQAGQDQPAEQAFKKALGGSGARKEAHKWLGEIYARRGQKAQAIESFKQYLKTSPKDADAIQKRIEKLSNA